ncbi:hypothetical protein [Cryptosporangium arvum]|uniref:hypothetical protein n=1 Tax=Cryptosporangium arvum TaxID=80871 RepID=UPI0005627106|nr:hypothetical protein [Cryptosporangium arvum]
MESGSKVSVVLATIFTLVVHGLSLVEFLPAPVAVGLAAVWAALVAILARWVRRGPVRSAWTEDVLVAFGATAMALFAFGGAVGLLMLSTALDTGSVTGEVVIAMFLPSIPIAILANAPTELVVMPMLLIVGWRPGLRRVLILVAAGLYFGLRVWTYLVFAGARLDFAGAEHSTARLTAAERAEFARGLHVDDPRWIVNLAIFVVLLVAAFASRVRELPTRRG